MDTDRAKTQQQIFADMHRELKAWNSKIPDSPDRLDPILKIMLHLYSHELSRIDQRVSDLWERATNSLIRSLNPECKRWPVPAYTIMKCEIDDPVVDIDAHTQFFYREEREGGQTFFFSPIKTERLVRATIRHAFLRYDDQVQDLTPDVEATGVGAVDVSDTSATVRRLYLGCEHDGPATDFSGARLFLNGHPNALKQLRWAYWYPSAASGQFYEDSGFCPGLSCTIDDVVSLGEDEDWGGLRSGGSLFNALENSFVIIPESFAGTWEPAPVEPDLEALLLHHGMGVAQESDRLFWVRLDLPDGGSADGLNTPLDLSFHSSLVTNRNELTLFKHTGGNQLVQIDVPEPTDRVLGITSVVDSTGKSYLPRHRLHTDLSAGAYVLDERGDRLTIWFDFSARRGLPPDSLTVTYAVTAGTAANGIGVGKINELYESHPGISGGQNQLPTTGAIPAKTEQQIVDEVAARLRGRDRALTFPEIARWATSFDPRIRRAECRQGIERTSSGVRRCIVVTLALNRKQFFSDDETALLADRLKSFLRSRAPINTHFQVETTG
jgi:hypothetical protein